MYNLMGFLQWGIKQSVEMETSLTSAERIIDFARLKPEKDTTEKTMEMMLDKAPVNKKWKSGRMKFENVNFRYYEEVCFLKFL